MKPRELSGIYFRVKQKNGKWESVDWLDLEPYQRADILGKCIDIEWKISVARKLNEVASEINGLLKHKFPFTELPFYARDDDELDEYIEMLSSLLRLLAERNSIELMV